MPKLLKTSGKPLIKKYKTKESGAKKHAVGRYLNFKMVDDKPILPQVHNLQTIMNESVKEGIQVDEQFQVAAIIEKLPPLGRIYRRPFDIRGRITPYSTFSAI